MFGLEIWVIASLLALAANLAKVLLVKTSCQTVDSWHLLFMARALPAILLLPSLFLLDYTVYRPLEFGLVTLSTSVITIAASLLYMEAVKQGDVSVVTPLQAVVPVFMMVCTYVLYREIPPSKSLIFIALIIASVSFVMYFNSKRGAHYSPHQLRPILYSLLAAALFGVSTVLDRVAVAATTHGALVFSAWWHIATVVLLIPVMWFKGVQQHLKNWRLSPHIAQYVGACLLAFLAQQYAVQQSLHVANGVTYVKTIVMTHLVIAAAMGIYYLKESVSRAILLANLVTGLSGVGLLWVI